MVFPGGQEVQWWLQRLKIIIKLSSPRTTKIIPEAARATESVDSNLENISGRGPQFDCVSWPLCFQEKSFLYYSQPSY